jgi:hypothetical protein
MWIRHSKFNSFEVLHVGSNDKLTRSCLPSEEVSSFASLTTETLTDGRKEKREEKPVHPVFPEAVKLLESSRDDVASRDRLGNRNFNEIMHMKRLGLSPYEAKELMMAYGRPTPSIADYERIYANNLYRMKGSTEANHYLFDNRHPVWKIWKTKTLSSSFQQLRNKRSRMKAGEWSDEVKLWKGDFGSCHATNNKYFWVLNLLGIFRIVKEQETTSDGLKGPYIIQVRYPTNEEEPDLITNSEIIKLNLRTPITNDEIDRIRSLLIPPMTT